MAKDKRVGLYLGVNSVGVAVIQGKDILSLGKVEFSSLDDSGGEIKNEDIRWEALINKTLREVGSDVKEVYVSLSDRDFILRLLEMPLMKKKEIESSLIYEIEKYIPFKIGDLVWDYDYVNFPRERKISLSFVGIKEGNFQRIKSILSRLDLKTLRIEPSYISLARVMKSLKKFAQLKNFVILDFTQAEASLTFFQQYLPVFNRYIIVPKKEEGIDLDNFVESVNFSFQYFKREFKSYKLDKFLIIGDSNLDSLVSPLKEGLQVDVEAVSSYDLTNRNNAKVENVKAFGTAGLEYLPYKFKPYLRKTEERSVSSEKVQVNIALSPGLLGVLIGIGLVATLFFSFMWRSDLIERRSILKARKKSIAVPADLDGLTWEAKAEVLHKEEKRIKFLKELLSSFVRFSPFFEKLASEDIFPSRLWLSDLDITGEPGEFKAVLTGYIFRNDDYEERLGVDEFISNLRGDKTISSIFNKIELDFSSRYELGEFEVTSFSVVLEQ